MELQLLRQLQEDLVAMTAMFSAAYSIYSTEDDLEQRFLLWKSLSALSEEMRAVRRGIEQRKRSIQEG